MWLVFSLILVCATTPIAPQMSFIGDAVEAFRPCGSSVLGMERIIGGPPNKENYWDGIVSIDKWPTLSEIRLSLTVDAPARIELDENVGRVSVRNRTFHISAYGRQPEVKTVKFTVRGTPKGVFPNVERLTLNDADVCPNPEKWSPSILGSSGNIGETQPEEEPKPKCGKRIVQHQQLITNGFPSKEGDWPWHSAVYHTEDLQQSYKCGGTLITSNAVLTAAHCVYEGGRALVPDRVIVQLGKHNLQLSGPNMQEFRAHRLIVHSAYSESDLLNDIAIIRLATEATFTAYVQPICVWDINRLALDEVIGRNGVVVGWGFNEQDKISNILSQANMPVVSFAECLISNRNFFGLFLSDGTYCAGFRNGTSVCNGDSGGGMYFENDGIYSLRGIVSLTVARSAEANICNPQEYVLFTDAARYLDWIRINSE